jgi:hypothetical protein
MDTAGVDVVGTVRFPGSATANGMLAAATSPGVMPRTSRPGLTARLSVFAVTR